MPLVCVWKWVWWGVGEPGLGVHFTCLCPFTLVIWTYTKYPSVCGIHVLKHWTLQGCCPQLSHLLLVLNRSFCPPQSSDHFLNQDSGSITQGSNFYMSCRQRALIQLFPGFQYGAHHGPTVLGQVVATVHSWMITLKKILKLAELSDTLTQTRLLSCDRGCQTQRPSWLSGLPLMLQLTRLFCFFTINKWGQQPLYLGVELNGTTLCVWWTQMYRNNPTSSAYLHSWHQKWLLGPSNATCMFSKLIFCWGHHSSTANHAITQSSHCRRLERKQQSGRSKKHCKALNKYDKIPADAAWLL